MLRLTTRARLSLRVARTAAGALRKGPRCLAGALVEVVRLALWAVVGHPLALHLRLLRGHLSLVRGHLGLLCLSLLCSHLRVLRLSLLRMSPLRSHLGLLRRRLLGMSLLRLLRRHLLRCSLLVHLLLHGLLHRILLHCLLLRRNDICGIGLLHLLYVQLPSRILLRLALLSLRDAPSSGLHRRLVNLELLLLLRRLPLCVEDEQLPHLSFGRLHRDRRATDLQAQL
mmetsp:Transcript_79063/g.232129  ORF Transcript_79063/g.232129 Transcript_79063/m.232129 type:complete len:227 (+) Transcript_79063:476-1156(+)